MPFIMSVDPRMGQLLQADRAPGGHRFTLRQAVHHRSSKSRKRLSARFCAGSLQARHAEQGSPPCVATARPEALVQHKQPGSL